MIIPDGYAQVNFIYTGVALPTGAQWTLGLDVNAYAGEPVDAAIDIAANLTESAIMPDFSTSVTITQIQVKFGPNATGPSAVHPTTISGTQAGAVVVPNTAMLVHKNTPFGGRAGRGRMYLPGLRDADVGDTGVITPAIVTALNTDFETFRGKMVADSLFPVVLHGDGSPILTPSAITSFSVDPIAATQRRRLRR